MAEFTRVTKELAEVWVVNTPSDARVTKELVEVLVNDTPSAMYVTKELVEVWTLRYNTAQVNSLTVIQALPCVGRDTTAAVSSPTVVESGFVYFNGHRISTAAVSSPTVVEADYVCTTDNVAVFSPTVIACMFKLGSFADVQSPTVIAGAGGSGGHGDGGIIPVMSKTAAAAVSSPTAIEAIGAVGTSVVVNPVVSLTVIKCFPFFRAVTPDCISDNEPAPSGGGGSRLNRVY